MKRLCTFLLACALTASLQAQTTADEVISNIIRAQGGREKLLSIKTVKMNGFLEFSGLKIPFNVYGLDKTAMRTDFTFSGMTGYVIVTRDSGFNFNPFQGQRTAEKMTAEDVALSRSDLDQQSILLDYKAKGYQVELLDNEDVDGVDAYQLKITISPKKTQYYFVDPSTYYVIRIKTVQESNGQQQRNAVDYYDFKTTKDGYLFPHTFDNITLNSIEVNTPLDDKLFRPGK